MGGGQHLWLTLAGAAPGGPTAGTRSTGGPPASWQGGHQAALYRQREGGRALSAVRSPSCIPHTQQRRSLGGGQRSSSSPARLPAGGTPSLPALLFLWGRRPKTKGGPPLLRPLCGGHPAVPPTPPPPPHTHAPTYPSACSWALTAPTQGACSWAWTAPTQELAAGLESRRELAGAGKQKRAGSSQKAEETAARKQKRASSG